MSESIEELRAQRRLIQQHLDWLDARIRQAGLNQKIIQPDEATEESPVASIPADSRNQETVETAASTTSKNTCDPIEAGLVKSSSASDIRSAQIGCFVLFAAITLLFLFVLFGLPYLLD